VLGAPTIGSPSPGKLGQGASTSVTLDGSNFSAPATISITGPSNTLTGKVTFVGASSLNVKVTVPANAATGSYTLNLTNGDGGTATCTGCLTVVSGPQVSSISPSSVAPGQQAHFTISGSGFSSDAKLSMPQGVGVSGVTISSDGTTITGTMSVSSTAATGSDLPVTVKDGPLGNYGTATFGGLTIT
jgi:hypothetical protein